MAPYFLEDHDRAWVRAWAAQFDKEMMELLMEDKFVVKDGGSRQQFATGSQRDTQAGKGRPDLIPPMVLRRDALVYEKGAQKYDEDNWKKGQPLRQYLASAFRHLLSAMDGQEDEDHLAQARWNLGSLMWTLEEIRAGRLPRELAKGVPYAMPWDKPDPGPEQTWGRSFVEEAESEHPEKFDGFEEEFGPAQEATMDPERITAEEVRHFRDNPPAVLDEDVVEAARDAMLHRLVGIHPLPRHSDSRVVGSNHAPTCLCSLCEAKRTREAQVKHIEGR